MQRGYFWKGVGLKRRGESDGEEEGDSDSQLQHLREDGENDVRCRWFYIDSPPRRGGYSRRCVISQGLRVHPHDTICNEEVQHQPQDCTEWDR